MALPQRSTVRGRTITRSDLSYAYAVAMKIVGHPDDAADIAQEALLQAHRFQHTFRGDSRYTTWLYRIVSTQALMHLRKRKRRDRWIDARDGAESQATLERVADPHSSPEEALASHEEVDLARKVLEEMGPRYEEAFFLRFGEGYSEREIGEQLGVGAATIKTRAYRARARVLDALA